MATLITDDNLAQRLIGERQRLGQDRYDEALQGKELVSVGETTLNSPRSLVSEVLGLAFDLQQAEGRPEIRLVRQRDSEAWSIYCLGQVAI